MASYLSYAPVAVFDSRIVDFRESALALARVLLENELPAMLISRSPSEELDIASRISSDVLQRGILPVIEFYTTDKSSQLRNLHESAVLGTVDLVWEDGEPLFEMADLLEFLLNTWKTRVPLDLNIFFRGKLPHEKAFYSTSRMIHSVMARNKHVQVVKLSEIPDSTGDSDLIDRVRSLWRMVIDACPDSTGALNPSLWADIPKLRSGIFDLGLDRFTCSDPCEDTYLTDAVMNAESEAGKMGLSTHPRLPLTIQFYKRSWFSINIGKVFTQWTERKEYSPYEERPEPKAR